MEVALTEAFGPLMDVGLGFDARGRNDLRDWDNIREYAHGFAGLLRE